MLVCRKSSNGSGGPRRASGENLTAVANGETRPAQGGPVFLPRRKPSALAQTLLAYAASGTQRLTPYDEEWFLGRPSP